MVRWVGNVQIKLWAMVLGALLLLYINTPIAAEPGEAAGLPADGDPSPTGETVSPETPNDTTIQTKPAALSNAPAISPPSSPVLWTELAPGLWHASVSYQQGHPFRVQAVRVSLAHYDIRALDARTRPDDGKVASVEQLAQNAGAALAINGSFFDEHMRPLGLVIDRSFRINPYRQADWGILYVDDGRATLVHTSDWAQTHPKRVWFALQVGPRLVVAGKPTRLKPQRARRAAIGILPDRAQLIVLATDRGSAEAGALAELMARPVVQGGFGCVEAVAMDGGPSAQLYLATDSLELSVRGGWPVPIAVGFVKKPQGGDGKP